MEVYLVFECDLSGLGGLYVPVSTIEECCQAAKDLLQSVLLYEEWSDDKTADSVMTIDRIDEILEKNKSIIVYGESGSSAALLKGTMGERNW